MEIKMKLDRFLALLFGRVGVITLAVLLILTLCLSTACSSGDSEALCTEGDLLSLFLCGCLTPETTCNICSCMADTACDAACSIPEACSDACDAWYDCDKGCISDCGDAYVDCLVGSSGSLVDCFSACDSADYSHECRDCGKKFNKSNTNSRCPDCNSSNIKLIAQMYACKSCGKSFSKSDRGYSESTGKYYCPYCVSYQIEQIH